MYIEITTDQTADATNGYEYRNYYRFAIRADYGHNVELRLDCYREESRRARRNPRGERMGSIMVARG